MANAAGLSADELRVRDACSQRAAAMLNDLTHLVNTPTGPGSGDGLPALRDWFTRRLEALGATTQQVSGDPKESWLEGPTARHGDGSSASVPPTLICRRRVAGAPSVLLCGHLDTVHEASSDFRSFTVDPSGKRATGPGCVDMKGGLVVALHALEALEASGIRVSWTFMLNSDEETGSYHSDAALRSEAAAGYNAAFDRVKGLMSCAPLFDLEKLPQADRQRYGLGAFAQHALQARHLIENGSTFVMVANGMPWDNHVFQHEMHQMLVPELDNVLYQLITDLEQRGMLQDTLVIAMGEFGRTPWLNEARGRDHYSKAWSLAMAGGGIRGGVVVGETDPLGFEVTKDAIDNRRLFATIFKALGIDPKEQYDLPDLPTFHRVEGNVHPIQELLIG